MTKHFTAVLTIHEVETKETGALASSRGFADSRRIPAEPPAKRPEPVEVAKLVLRAPTLPALQSKLSGHVGLLVDEEPVE